MYTVVAVVDISLDSQSYTVMENVGDSDLGLTVCATVFGATFEFTVLLVPQDGSAEGRVKILLLSVESFPNHNQSYRLICLHNSIDQTEDNFV